MSTHAQISANQANAQHSTGPKTEEGKAASCLNNFQTGLTGSSFCVLPWENEEDYDTLHAALRASLEPSGPFERLLVEKAAQHQWLAQRALVLQDMCFQRDIPNCDDDKKLALYLRYQTTHERAFHKYLDQLHKLRAEVRKNRIGFESQERERNQESRRAAAETRKQEAHEARTRLAHAKAAHLELDTEIRSTIEARIPGDVEIPFHQLKDVLRVSLQDVARNLTSEKAA
ncbi:MAG TPA: hypothetical protein VHU83_11300 [Bryobacteraceae bacterium]|jgi:hypothetical protein|nr:hypothetical protein [Bryobacteraceae bacterium]